MSQESLAEACPACQYPWKCPRGCPSTIWLGSLVPRLGVKSAELPEIAENRKVSPNVLRLLLLGPSPDKKCACRGVTRGGKVEHNSLGAKSPRWRQSMRLAPNDCGGSGKFQKMTQVQYFLQYSTFASGRPQVETWGAQR